MEDPARLDPAGQDAVDQVGQEAADGCRAAARAGLREEQLQPVDGHLVRDADVATGAGRVRGLPRGPGGADALQGRVHADAAGQLLDPGDALLADDVGRAELGRRLLPGLAPAHGDDPVGAPSFAAMTPHRPTAP